MVLKLATKFFGGEYSSWVRSGMLFTGVVFSNAFAELAKERLHYQAAINIAVNSTTPAFAMGVSVALFHFALESAASRQRIPDPKVFKPIQQPLDQNFL